MNEKVVGGLYRLKRRIGGGSFGEIYSAENIRSHRRVAVKLESTRSKVPQLSYEAKLYKIFSGGTGIPKLHWYGSEGGHNIMVIDLMGKSLEDLFVRCHHKFSLKTVLMLADQMLTCVEYLHSKNFIHRDIKPDNFVMGLGKTASQVFIIDYGLSKKYRDQDTHIHISYCEGKSLTGTARYASVAALKGIEQSRRDDLESLGFVWLYLLRGSLPWMGLACRDTKHKYEKICEVKSKTPFAELCRGFPNEFVRYFETVRALKFTEKPNYTELRKMFRDLFIREGFVYDYRYDWSDTKTELPPPVPMPSPAPKPVHEDKEKERKREKEKQQEKEKEKEKEKEIPLASARRRRPALPAALEDRVIVQSQPTLRPESAAVTARRRVERVAAPKQIPKATAAPQSPAEMKPLRLRRVMTDTIPQSAVPSSTRRVKPVEERVGSQMRSARRVESRMVNDGSHADTPRKTTRTSTARADPVRTTLMPRWMHEQHRRL